MKSFVKQTTFFCCFFFSQKKELFKISKTNSFREPSLITGPINNIGLCIGARFWPQKANSQMARVKLSSVLFLFQRVIIGIVLAFIVAIAELYFMARVEI